MHWKKQLINWVRISDAQTRHLESESKSWFKSNTNFYKTCNPCVLSCKHHLMRVHYSSPVFQRIDFVELSISHHGRSGKTWQDTLRGSLRRGHLCLLWVHLSLCSDCAFKAQYVFYRFYAFKVWPFAVPIFRLSPAVADLKHPTSKTHTSQSLWKVLQSLFSDSGNKNIALLPGAVG